jgi:hypothetical protein
MIIDPTTHSTVYNPLSSQGQWAQHRFGKRDYPDLTLDLETVLHSLDSISEGFFVFDRPIYLKSTYGDAGLWKDVTRLSKLVGGMLTVSTYGMLDAKVIKTIKHHQAMIHVFCDGFEDDCGKVFLGAEWESIANLLSIANSNAMVEFFVFEHNKHQIPYIITFCAQRNVKIKFTPGISNDNIGSCVIDHDSNWLYDVLPVELETEMLDADYDAALLREIKDKYSNVKPVQLKRHLENYNSLRTFIVNKKGRGLLQLPMISQLIPHNQLQKFDNPVKDDIHITPTGHVTENAEEYHMFLNMVSSDWEMTNKTVSKINHLDEYGLKTLYYAQKFNKEFLKSRKVQSYFN